MDKSSRLSVFSKNTEDLSNSFSLQTSSFRGRLEFEKQDGILLGKATAFSMEVQVSSAVSFLTEDVYSCYGGTSYFSRRKSAATGTVDEDPTVTETTGSSSLSSVCFSFRLDTSYNSLGSFDKSGSNPLISSKADVEKGYRLNIEYTSILPGGGTYDLYDSYVFDADMTLTENMKITSQTFSGSQNQTFQERFALKPIPEEEIKVPSEYDTQFEKTSLALVL